MSLNSINELQSQETSAKPHKSQAVSPSHNIPKFAKIVEHAHIPHAIRAGTTVDTACSITNIAKIVNQAHKPHSIRRNTTVAYTEHKLQSNHSQEEKRNQEVSEHRSEAGFKYHQHPRYYLQVRHQGSQTLSKLRRL